MSEDYDVLYDLFQKVKENDFEAVRSILTDLKARINPYDVHVSVCDVTLRGTEERLGTTVYLEVEDIQENWIEFDTYHCKMEYRDCTEVHYEEVPTRICNLIERLFEDVY